ncbi:MAG: GAF domain-containing protein [Anaerolineae bacterium]|nr:GAF domain-containing protein [Anaerolineae bacterium]
MSISESQRLESLYRIARALHDQDMNVQSILQTVLSMAGKAIGAPHGCVITFNSIDAIEQAYILGENADDPNERTLWEILINQGLIGFAVYGRRTVIVRDLQSDPRWPQLPKNTFIPYHGSAIGLPLEKNGRILGVMILVHDQVDYFTDEIVAMLEAIANISSAAITNAVEFSSAHASKTRYQWLFNDSIVPIILTDLHGNVVDANRQACAFLEYDHDAIKEQHIALIHRMGTGPLGASRFSSLQTGKELEFRTTAWTESGTEIPVSVRARRLSFENEDVIEWVEQDISAQLELEQLRADLSAMVYHDLRGPLQTINNSLALLHRLLGKQENQSIPELIQVGIRSVRRLSRMVESLLDIQRLEEGKAVLDRKTISLHSLLAEAAQLVQPLALEVNQELNFDVNEEMPWLKIDSDMILRVVTNLMENAVKYTPENGTITLSAHMQDDEVQISITDSGPGIPPHMQRQIFDKFSRVKYTDAPRGLGLGLAFCRLAVEAHGGRIWVESEPGRGSTFLFSLPLQSEQEPANAN